MRRSPPPRRAEPSHVPFGTASTRQELPYLFIDMAVEIIPVLAERRTDALKINQLAKERGV